MRVLVTGAAGFIGHELIRTLAQRGHAVIALDALAPAIPVDASVTGDIRERAVRARALAAAPEAVIHLASVPGAAAEADPELSEAINLDASLALLRESAAVRPGLRWVQASTIAVYGQALPSGGVDDETPHGPRMIYGLHKAMVETAVGTYSRRGSIDGISLRLPGVVARPRAASGLRSAFMSNVFHALAADEDIEVPVSPQATLWLMSLTRACEALARALSLDTSAAPEGRAITVPALRVRFDELVTALSARLGVAVSRVSYRMDADLQAAMGAYPPLRTPAAERLGLDRAESLDHLVASALRTLH